MSLRFLAVLVIVSSAGCSLDRLTLVPGERDASMVVDSGGIDAGPELDGGDRPDAGLDASDAAIDAFVPDDGGPCVTGPDSDGDGVADACDVCASGDDAQDRDGDDVPDACDACPDGDDALDDDGDGIADGCDDWPCGIRPSIAASVTREWITISGVSIEDGGNTAVVRRDAEYDLAFSFAIDDTGCGGCRDQIEIGTEPGGRSFCAYDANPPGTGASGDVTRQLTAPSATGIVELRFNMGQNHGCEYEGADDWWEGAPPSDHTFGVLCVVP